jgi:hypothetical protein
MPGIPAIEHLMSCSKQELQQKELAVLDLAAQCMKRADEEIKQAVALRGEAEVYRLMIDDRDELINLAKRVADGRQGLLRFPSPGEAGQQVRLRA